MLNLLSLADSSSVFPSTSKASFTVASSAASSWLTAIKTSESKVVHAIAFLFSTVCVLLDVHAGHPDIFQERIHCLIHAVHHAAYFISIPLRPSKLDCLFIAMAILLLDVGGGSFSLFIATSSLFPNQFGEP